MVSLRQEEAELLAQIVFVCNEPACEVELRLSFIKPLKLDHLLVPIFRLERVPLPFLVLLIVFLVHGHFFVQSLGTLDLRCIPQRLLLIMPSQL